MPTALSRPQIDHVLELLGGRLARNEAPPVRMVVCGGAAMIVTGLLSRTTTDVDIVALLDDSQRLVAPVPLPDYLLRAARWTLTHDVSPGFRMLLKRLLETLGYEDTASAI